jgi:hypothetical protein
MPQSMASITPEIAELPTKEPNPSQDNSYAFGYNRAITESIELLNRQGVKIKNES